MEPIAITGVIQRLNNNPSRAIQGGEVGVKAMNGNLKWHHSIFFLFIHLQEFYISVIIDSGLGNLVKEQVSQRPIAHNIITFCEFLVDKNS